MVELSYIVTPDNEHVLSCDMVDSVQYLQSKTH
jgi:hypothetical protein